MLVFPLAGNPVRVATGSEFDRMSDEVDLDTEGGGHGFTYYNVMAERAVGFIAQRLEKERLRL